LLERFVARSWRVQPTDRSAAIRPPPVKSAFIAP